MDSYLFYTEDESYCFEIEAKDINDAYEKAYEEYGPQVDDMYYRLVYNGV